MRQLIGIVGVLVLAAGTAAQQGGSSTGFSVGAVIQKIDPDKRTVVVFAEGQDRTLPVTKDAKFVDKNGKELEGGLKAKELKEGAEVTITVVRDGGPAIRAIQLGRREGRPVQQPPPKVDLSKFKPLTDMGPADRYQGVAGGLYPDGQNQRPATHEAAGVALARKVQPLDADGRPSKTGKIVLLAVGMSNTSQAFSKLRQVAQDDPSLNPHLVLVNGAQGGMTAAAIQNPDDNGRGTQYWKVVNNRLQEAGVTPNQVQAVWIKQADAGPNQGFPRYAQTLQAELANIVRVLPQRFPNVKLVYLSPRTFGGWAKTQLNPEPYAYESGFAVKWLIEQQLKGDPMLNYDPAKGEVKAPWLSWGPYLWANGENRRKDGFSYDVSDFAADGTHESPSGQEKVAKLLLTFFKTDSTTRGWFVKAGAKP
jgi:hypothetical protein